ncbi:hypothetical protein KL86SPO_40468 [uncultured Sporomusa sp.]|uniref:Uncharacterized protein n=1 Tax=uncultured Sporomusa sp. TaxID=307249 RepID=A0A212LWP7_9FIRM|nr:hypothetical protein KL86SPO_40468 [uncultured Sporomusa sp.]
MGNECGLHGGTVIETKPIQSAGTCIGGYLPGAGDCLYQCGGTARAGGHYDQRAGGC